LARNLAYAATPCQRRASGPQGLVGLFGWGGTAGGPRWNWEVLDFSARGDARPASFSQRSPRHARLLRAFRDPRFNGHTRCQTPVLL